MIDIDKQIAYWRAGANEDWDVAQELVGRGRTRHGLFFAHLALEKLLKAHVCRHTQDLAPRIHPLLRLADLAGLTLSGEQREFLAWFDQYQIEGRYPDTLLPAPSVETAQAEMARAGEVFQWLTDQF